MADSDNSMGDLEEESMLIDYSPAIHCDLEESNEVFNEEEEMLVARMFKLVGERWSLIAGRIPGRTADEIEKYWTPMNYSSEVCDDK